jgi:TM2 domain-containing membrane protein YozV
LPHHNTLYHLGEPDLFPTQSRHPEDAMHNDDYHFALLSIFNSLPETKRDEFIRLFAGRTTSPSVVYGFSVWLGVFGIDRFVLGQPVLGVVKLLTLGGFYIWYLVDLFLVAGKAREKNIEFAKQVQSSLMGAPPAMP